MSNILLIDPPFNKVGVEWLSQRHDVFVAPDGKEQTLISYAQKHKISALVSRTEQITKTIVENCPKLLVIGQACVGIENIDVNACTDAGVVVVHAPAGNFISVAEHTIMFILTLSRHLANNDTLVRQGKWMTKSAFLPSEIHSKTLFLIGTGRSAQETARLARAFHMNVKVYSRTPDHNLFLKNGIEVMNSLEQGLECADYVSLHVPLTNNTRNLISTNQLSLMKKNAYLINMSRGAVVNDRALYDALSKKNIAGAALDVFTCEPPDTSASLFKLPNVIFTPHIGGDSHEAILRSVTAVAQDIDRILYRIAPIYPANPDVLQKVNCRFRLAH